MTLRCLFLAGLPNTLEEAVERVANSTSATGFAFLGDATDIRYQVLTKCNLQVFCLNFLKFAFNYHNFNYRLLEKNSAENHML